MGQQGAPTGGGAPPPGPVGRKERRQERRQEARQDRQEARADRRADRQEKKAAKAGAAAGAPAAGSPGKGGGQPAAPAPDPNQPAAPGAGPQSFTDWLNQAYGAGNPFGMQTGNYQDPNNPMYQAATRNYQQALGSQRERFGQGGGGLSDREALMEGQAAGDYGAQIAQLGTNLQQQDANRALQATNQFLNFGNQQTQNLANTGTQLTGVGASEQNMPNMAPLLSMLSNFSTMWGGGSTSGRQGGGMFGAK